jgi:hypothetical protein
LTYKDLKTMLTNIRSSGMTGGNMVLEKDDKGKLRLTYSMVSSGRYRRTETARYEQMLTQTKATGTWKFVMPGKVLSSSLPDVKDNTASITFDTAKQESVDALKKLITDGVVVVAEPGRLKMDDLPLDSTKLAMARYEPPQGPGKDLPIVDAAPGFRVKPLSVSTSSVHYFDGAEKFPDQLEMVSSSATNSGCVVYARLFPPKDRQVLSLDSARVLKAVDDHNREVKSLAAEDQGRSGFRTFRGGGDEPKYVDLQLHLALPQPDAEALEKIQGEAVVTSFGKWKEHTIKDPKADPKNVIDLADVLPDTTMIIKDIKERKPRGQHEAASSSVVIEIKGPKGVQSVEFTMRPEDDAGEERGYTHSYVNSDRSSVAQGKSVRTVTLSTTRAGQNQGKLVLVVRYPDDIKRERVSFTLEAVDLF